MTARSARSLARSNGRSTRAAATAATMATAATAPAGGMTASFNRLVRILREGLSRVGERQSDFTAKLVEAAFSRVMATLTAQVKNLADTIIEAAVRGDEAVAKQLGEAVTKSISKNADVAELCAKLAERVVALETEMAMLKAQRDRPFAGEEGTLQ
jgi:acylphosphatase